MAEKVKKDMRFPTFILDSPIRKLMSDPASYDRYIGKGQTVADIGCGPGFFTIALARAVGAQGTVYAVDFDERSIRVVKRKALKHAFKNIEARVASAVDLGYISSNSVDFVLADGLLCSMAPQGHQAAVREIKRILKPTGKAFLKVAKGAPSFVDLPEWEKILSEFRVEERSPEPSAGDRFAIVKKR